MLLSDFIKFGVSSLSAVYPPEEARSLIGILNEGVLGVKNYTHIVDPQYEIPDTKLAELESCLQRLQRGEPIQYILGKAEFYGRTFRVHEAVLIPRPETEILCEKAIEECACRKSCRILDLCTGSGCIAWTMALSVAGAEVTGVDISDEALEVARNQEFDSPAGKPSFIKADVLDFHNEIGMFDLILSNPPYIKESEKTSMRANVLDHEPELALFVSDEDPLIFYRAIAEISAEHLNADGVGITEINETLGTQTADVFKSAGFTKVSIVKDIFDRNRFVIYYR